MSFSLNFSSGEKEKLMGFLKKFPMLELKSGHEALRCRIGKSTVTFYKSGKLLIQGNDSSQVKEKILKEMDFGKELVVGIDETGRGESFGAFVICAVLGESNKLRELRDSKKTSNIEEKAKIVLQNSIASAKIEISPELIDELREKGFTMDAIEARAINHLSEFFLELEPKAKIKVDGKGLKGVSSKIEFIVKGDDLEPVIGAASVLAKYYREKSPNKKERKSWKSKTK